MSNDEKPPEGGGSTEAELAIAAAEERQQRFIKREVEWALSTMQPILLAFAKRHAWLMEKNPDDADMGRALHAGVADGFTQWMRILSPVPLITGDQAASTLKGLIEDSLQTEQGSSLVVVPPHLARQMKVRRH